ncbi:MAG: ABC transporter ATP-binding protein [Chloroflexi bacterium]|nr:ABC transporter ATP-binding protein [Chloroflexota bacterium]
MSGSLDAVAIRCMDVAFTYPGGTRALDGVDLEIRVGERVAIVGQNGSGKSTLVRQFNGLLHPDAGQVEVLGVPTAGRHVAELARDVGLAFQNPDRQIFAGRVGREVEFGPRNIGRSGPELAAAVDAALESVGLDGMASVNPYDLGFSRRKLLAIASILAMRTPIVILDEPTTGQDARSVERVQRIVTELGDAGRTVVAISHDLRFVATTFDRVVVMREGHVVLDGPPEVVFAEASWPLLASAALEPPFPARVGVAANVGPTPTLPSLIRALSGDADSPSG